MLLVAIAPASVHAMEIGEITLLSNLGEPLNATVDMQLAQGEKLDNSCLSLFVVGENGKPASWDYQSAKLNYRYNQSTHNIQLRSQMPFNEPFAMLRIQVKCEELVGSKILTLLPKVASNAVTPPSVTVATKPPVSQRPKDLTKADTVTVPARLAKSAPSTPAKKSDSESNASNVAAPADNTSALKLKLSEAEIDVSSLGKLSAEARSAILAQQKLLDANDPTSQFIATQQQLRQAQDEVDKLRLQIARIEVSKAAAAQLPASAPSSDPLVRNALLGLAAIVLLVSVAFGMRHLSKSQSASAVYPRKKDFATQPAKEVSPQTANIVHPIDMKQPSIGDDVRSEAIVLQDIQSETDQPIEDEHAVLEEAELYSVYGHADKGIRILKEFLVQHPRSEKSWTLLLSIYASSGQSQEFEKSARDFLNRNKNSSSLKIVQALGRTLDRDNPLYAEEMIAGEAEVSPLADLSAQRPIGDILIELGYLSAQDLQNCLGDFDHAKHGRFGNYLLTRRMINHAQLNEALLRQQTSGMDGVGSHRLSSLEKVAESLKDFHHLDENAAQMDAPILAQSESPSESEHSAGTRKLDVTIPLDFSLGTDKNAVFKNDTTATFTEEKPVTLEFDSNLYIAPSKEDHVEAANSRPT